MVRLVLGGPDLQDLRPAHADAYVKLAFPTSDSDRPLLRTYTVRAWDEVTGELTLDFVVHGDAGVAGPWAAAAAPGDEVAMRGPGGGYTPAGDAGWHLLIGDETALPALAVALEQMPAGAHVVVVVEIADDAEQQALATAHLDAAVHWVSRARHGGAPGAALVAAVADLDLEQHAALRGPPQTFVHGEAGAVRALRRSLPDRVQIVPREHSFSGYWRLGRTDDVWREEKQAWAQEDAADDAARRVARTPWAAATGPASA